MSCLDFLVHRVLYSYGLRFSYSWAVPYWWLYGGVFLVFSVVVSFAYWLGSGRSRRNIRVGFGLFLSVCLLFWGGLTDVLWFVLWNGGLPADSVSWWWTPWFQLFGFWNSSAQLLLLCGVSILLVLLWVLICRLG